MLTMAAALTAGLLSSVAFAAPGNNNGHGNDDQMIPPGQAQQHGNQGHDNKSHAQGNQGHAKEVSHAKPDQKNSYFHQHGYTKLDIPKSAYPPPGQCRVWYPGRAESKQPGFSNCNAKVPAGAWMMRHPSNNSDITISVYGQSGISAQGVFSLDNGTLLQVLLSP
ncbi:hypothetical protein ACKC9G_14985 [Pokkaliibacter sp. CJK22405]|uniref:hypothetical protein n=1 Tax=Pokkaliibacter sp. CJK22405 TaxID=3384615 RepID=UPI003984E11C